MKKLFLFISIILLTNVAFAQSLPWSPFYLCHEGGSRFGISLAGGVNHLYTDYSDNYVPVIDGLYKEIGMFAQFRSARLDFKYWRSGEVRLQSFQLPGELKGQYSGLDVILNYQPFRWVYAGFGLSVVDADVSGTETNQTVPNASFPWHPTAQIGLELPIGSNPSFSLFVNFQARLDDSGRQFDYYVPLPSQTYADYDKSDWINSISFGIKGYAID